MKPPSHILKQAYNKKNKKDSNQIILDGERSYIVLYNRDLSVKDFTVIDTIYIDKVKQFNWYKDSDGYVKAGVRNFGQSNLKLHRFIMNALSGTVVDHIDHDKTNNVINNLSIGTQKENNQNISKRKDNKTGVVGVRIREDNGKYRAYINYNNKPINLGTFTEFYDAVNARRNAELKYYNKELQNYENI